MKKIVKECIAAGSIVFEKDADGKLVKEIVAAVYEEVVDGEESASANESGAGEGKKSVVLKYKNFAYTEDVTAPLSFDDIAGDDALVVPGINGHENVLLSAPVAIRYSRTKSFVRKDGNTAVYATIRYDM